MNFIKTALGMQDNGHHVKVYCVAQSPIAERLKSTGLETSYVRQNGKYFDLISALRLAKRFKRDRAEVLWLADNRDLGTIGFAKMFSGSRFKLVYHQTMKLGRPKRDWNHTQRFKRIDAWVTLLPYLKKQIADYTQYDSNRVHVVPLAGGVVERDKPTSSAEARAHFGIPTDTFLIGILGRISAQKGQTFAVEQLAALRDKGRKVSLLVVGEPTREEHDGYEAQMLKRIKELNLAEVVYTAPFMKDPEPFFKAINLFVMASEGETFGMVTVEAMQFGVSVLGTNSAGTPEILEHGELGYLYPYADGDAFRQQVERMLDAPQEAQAKAQQAQARAKTVYSSQVVADGLEEVLQQMMKA